MAVGGPWLGADHNGRNFIYKNLHINTSKCLTAFEEYPFPKDTQVVLDHLDMARYLQGYAEHFGLIDKVRSVVRLPRSRLQGTVFDADAGKLLTTGSVGEFFFDKMFVFGRRYHYQLLIFLG